MNKLTLFGPPDAPELYPLRDFLQRSVVQYDWVDATANHAALPVGLRQAYASGQRVPAIAFPNGQLVLNPTVQEVAQHLGWITKPSHDIVTAATPDMYRRDYNLARLR